MFCNTRAKVKGVNKLTNLTPYVSLRTNWLTSLWNCWDKEFQYIPSKICGRQPLKNLKQYGIFNQTISLNNLLKVVSHKFYLVHLVIFCLNLESSFYLVFASSELFQHQLLNALMLQFHFDVASKNLSVLDGFDIEQIGVLLTTSLAILLCNNELLPNEKNVF